MTGLRNRIQFTLVMNSLDRSIVRGQWCLPDLLQRAGVCDVRGHSCQRITTTSLTADSRAVEPGSVYVAIHGERVDGHDFIESAVRAGAVAIISEKTLVSEKTFSVSGKINNVQVSDSREAFSKLAAACSGLRDDADADFRLIGVTGTNGKTTVAWLLRSILQAAGQQTALIGTIEYDLICERQKASLTTPDALELCTLLATAKNAGATYCVLEVSSHALEQRRCDGLTFAANIFTNLSGDHLDYHRSMESYFNAKRRLFDLVEPDSLAVVNRDDPYGSRLIDTLNTPVVSYGLDSENVDVGATIHDVSQQGIELLIRGKSFEHSLRLSMIGKHNIANYLAAVATAEALGIDPKFIGEGLERVRGVPGRLQRVESGVDSAGGLYSVFVDYAHTDAALDNVLAALKPLTTGRLICVFGCGGDRDREKRPRMASVAQKWSDVVFVTSDNPRGEQPEAIIEQILPGFRRDSSCQVQVEVDRKKAIEAAISCAGPGDSVIIAGKGHEDYQLIGDQVIHFDDVEVARACMEMVRMQEEVA